MAQVQFQINISGQIGQGAIWRKSCAINNQHVTRRIIFQDPGVARTSSWSLPGGNRVISLFVPQAPPSFSPPSATQPATQCETMPHTLSATLVQCHTNDGRPCQCLAPLAHIGVVPNFLSVYRSPLCQRRPHNTRTPSTGKNTLCGRN